MADEWKEVSVVWEEGLTFTGINAEGSSIKLGSKPDETIGPMELLLVSLAGCTGIDVVNILKKKRLELDEFRVEVKGRRRQEHPRIYEEITVRYILRGEDLPKKDVEQAIQLSEEKYCSVSAMLLSASRIRTDYEIVKG